MYVKFEKKANYSQLILSLKSIRFVNSAWMYLQPHYGNGVSGNVYLSAGPHWTYLLQILSKLRFQRVDLSGNYEIVAISTRKTHFLMTYIIKLTLGNIFTKVKNPPGGATVTK